MPFKFGLFLLALMYITQHCVAVQLKTDHADQLKTDKEDDIPDLSKQLMSALDELKNATESNNNSQGCSKHGVSNVCADRELTSRCEDWKKRGHCNTDPSGVYIYCFKTCGGCNYLCHDSRSDCDSLKARGLCQTSVSDIRACPATCGACLRV